MKGANVAISTFGLPSLSFCQCASPPSPRHDTIPMPVISASRDASATGRLQLQEADARGGVADVAGHVGIWKIDHAEGEYGVADALAVHLDERLGDGVAGAFVLQRGGD